MIKTRALSEICSPKQWKTIPSSALCDEGYPVYGANGVIGRYSEYNHRDRTLLVTCRGATCGEVNVCEPFSYVTGNAMSLDNLSEDVSIDYLEAFLKSYDFRKVISGSAQPQITKGNIGRIRVPIYDCKIQTQIARVFALTSAIIHQFERVLEYDDQLVKSRFNWMEATVA